ncbi:hypothetical protein GCM10009733_029530 [Nonomuraea maheshkhaliensis]|uniref:Uncharacterized protein n=1 Tax=Nonomuraea maheshkhaliensis TaxID=419590 RepID=A0ABN2F4S9_9ACTN
MTEEERNQQKEAVLREIGEEWGDDYFPDGYDLMLRNGALDSSTYFIDSGGPPGPLLSKLAKISTPSAALDLQSYRHASEDAIRLLNE